MDSSRTHRNRPSWVGSLALLLLVPGVLRAQSRADELRWLTGCWERRTPNTVIEEHWSAPAGGTLLMFGRTLRGDRVLEYEFVRIYAKGDTLVYDAHPSGQPPAEFRALPPFDAAVTFENPTHDFPQRVIYRRAGSDSLLARVEGTRNGQTRGIDFAYGRVRCS